jgi:hypothetical protein
MFKLKIVGLATLLLFSIGAGKIILSKHGDPQTQTKADEEATPIQEGVMTQKQREHSKLYKQYSGRRNISELVTKEVDFKIVVKSEPQPAFMQDLACEADAVIIGAIQSKSSQLTEDKNFIFTDYDLVVEEVLKDNFSSPINPGATITVTRPGGAIKLKSKIVRATDESFKPFAIDGHYLLFLRYLPASNSYQAVNSAGGFRIENGKVFQLRKDQLLDVSKSTNDRDVFVSNVRTAISSCKDGKGSAD